MLKIIPKSEEQMLQDRRISYVFEFEAYKDGEINSVNDDNGKPKNEYLVEIREGMRGDYQINNNNFELSLKSYNKFKNTRPDACYYDYNIKLIKGKKYKILVKGSNFMVIPNFDFSTEEQSIVNEIFPFTQFIPLSQDAVGMTNVIIEKENTKAVTDRVKVTPVNYNYKPKQGDNTPAS